MDYPGIRKELLAVCRQLPANNLATGSTGNISARDNESGNIVIKRSSVPYDVMTEEDFIVVDMDGKVLSAPGGGKPSFETPTHLALYQADPEIRSVLHTHIPMTIVLSASRDHIESNLTPTSRRLLKRPLPVIPFVENGTEEMAVRVTEAIRGNVGMVIRNHGPFVIGDSIQTAFERTIALRDASELYYHMILIGKPSLVPPLEQA
ncbi:MAG: class II aldolase/adducin family protein [Planctomycetes bacterium]|nr:class II aldolase/adducin family protein [Planctomycetota bacterium]